LIGFPLRDYAMNSLVETIGDALTRLGPATEGRLNDVMTEMIGLGLGEEDQLSALATAVAAVTAIHHGRHRQVYLEAVRVWSLEISAQIGPPPSRRDGAGGGPVDEGAEILIAGLESLVDAMLNGGIRLQDRLVAELALFAQLLGQHDANAIHLTLMAVVDALNSEDYRPGRLLHVPLGDLVLPLGRDACLASLAPRGVA
jgi:hypothetical protein